MERHPPFHAILLGGGTGTRMGAAIPKQFLAVKDKPLIHHSFEVFLAMPELKSLVIVCDESYRHLFQCHPKILFARPGERRQDSVYNGLQALQEISSHSLIAIHDSARPLIDVELVRRVVERADHCGAAVAGVKVKATIKQCDEEQCVIKTVDRHNLWEMQTPQVIRKALLEQGFQKAVEEGLTVTDDVSLVELIGQPVQVVEGSSANIKVTTPEDLLLIQPFYERRCTGIS